MRIEDVTADGCVCMWQEPEDDGGSPVTSYLVEKIINGVTSAVGKFNKTKAVIKGLATGKEHRIQARYSLL